MTNCLVTQLKGVVQDDNLFKIGEIRYSCAAGGSILIGTTSEAVVTILTPGVTFTNSGFVGETTQTVTSAGARTVSVSGDCIVSINNKYNLTRLKETSTDSVSCDVNQVEYSNNIKSIRLTGANSIGDIKAFKNMSAIEELIVVSGKLVGNIDNLPNSTALWDLELQYSNISGSISNLSRLSSLTDLNLSSTKVTGNVSVFENLQNIRHIFIRDTAVSGSISAFANHSNLRTLNLEGSAITVSGTLGELIVNTPALKSLTLPSGVLYTAADAAAADTLLQGNGGTLQPSGHYFSGGTLVDSY